jgi:hypothetical protein
LIFGARREVRREQQAIQLDAWNALQNMLHFGTRHTFEAQAFGREDLQDFRMPVRFQRVQDLVDARQVLQRSRLLGERFTVIYESRLVLAS